AGRRARCAGAVGLAAAQRGQEPAGPGPAQQPVPGPEGGLVVGSPGAVPDLHRVHALAAGPPRAPAPGSPPPQPPPGRGQNGWAPTASPPRSRSPATARPSPPSPAR